MFGTMTPEEISQRANLLNSASEFQFQQARQMMRNVMGVNYEKRISDYKGMLQDVMKKFNLQPLMACEHCILELEQKHHKSIDPDGWAKLCFLAAALDMVEPEVRRN